MMAEREQKKKTTATERTDEVVEEVPADVGRRARS